MCAKHCTLVSRHFCSRQKIGRNNIFYSFINDVMIVKATEDIKADQEIFRSYTSAVSSSASIELIHADVDNRKRLLKDLCFLKCKCKACVDPKLSMVNISKQYAKLFTSSRILDATHHHYNLFSIFFSKMFLRCKKIKVC